MDLSRAETYPCSDVRRWTKPTVGQTTPRHELVTARAISRLSHSVAQLSASSNGSSHNNHSTARCNSRIKGGKHAPSQHSSPRSLATSGSTGTKSSTAHSTRDDIHKRTVTGAKRKWESDSRGSHIAMDVDQHISETPRTDASAVIIPTGSVAQRHTLTPADKISVISEPVGHDSSSCSSMHSISSSSSPSNHSPSGSSSEENEADAEGDGDESGSHSRYTSPAHSRTSMSPFGVPGPRKSSHVISSAIPQSKRGPRTSRGSVCGGDSSDDLANDEQSDFPTDEFLSPRCRTSVPKAPSLGSYRGAVPRPARSTSHSRRHHPSRHCPTAWKLTASTFPSGSPDPTEMDSEWEEIMQGTWPLLSHRARLDYLQGVAWAGSRCTRSSAPDVDPHRIDFVPSRLNEVHTNQAGSNISNCKTLPTPPWVNAETRYNMRIPLSDDLNLQAMDSSPDGHATRAGFGSRAPLESNAEPISQTNSGHKLLQKLGWEPGTGLGRTHQGMLDPVGCMKFNEMSHP
ncbi:unnamed protein product [Echinostoma caproni]|uniref:G-patch domain-containing protein n=1 Tax=Echinostoma caproni TaxID=27848 RepID=A0A183AJ40_9TREM|nr:unnamed protein product [Echinostoma caproni]